MLLSCLLYIDEQGTCVTRLIHSKPTTLVVNTVKTNMTLELYFQTPSPVLCSNEEQNDPHLPFCTLG